MGVVLRRKKHADAQMDFNGELSRQYSDENRQNLYSSRDELIRTYEKGSQARAERFDSLIAPLKREESIEFFRLVFPHEIRKNMDSTYVIQLYGKLYPVDSGERGSGIAQNYTFYRERYADGHDAGWIPGAGELVCARIRLHADQLCLPFKGVDLDHLPENSRYHFIHILQPKKLQNLVDSNPKSLDSEDNLHFSRYLPLNTYRSVPGKEFMEGLGMEWGNYGEHLDVGTLDQMDLARCEMLWSKACESMQRLYTRAQDSPLVLEKMRAAEKRDRRKAREINEAADGLRRFVDAISSD